MNDKKKHTIFTVTITDKETGEIAQSFDTDAIVASTHDLEDKDASHSVIVTGCNGMTLLLMAKAIERTAENFKKEVMQQLLGTYMELEEDDE